MTVLTQLRRLVRRLRFVRLHQPEAKLEWVELGSDYGGWPVIPTRLPPSPLVYSFGVGRDISFDLAVIARFGAEVHAFDPTPRAMAWIERQNLPARLTFHPIGIGGSDGTAQFFPPAKDDWDSFSSAPAPDQSGSAVSAPICRLDTIMERLGHDKIDILKMDIEGFEYDVVRSLEEIKARPDHLLVEFHHRMYQSGDDDTRRAVATLRNLGYRLFFVSDTGHEYGFVHGPVSVGRERRPEPPLRNI